MTDSGGRHQGTPDKSGGRCRKSGPTVLSFITNGTKVRQNFCPLAYCHPGRTWKEDGNGTRGDAPGYS